MKFYLKYFHPLHITSQKEFVKYLCKKEGEKLWVKWEKFSCNFSKHFSSFLDSFFFTILYDPPLTYSLVILTLSKMNFLSINKETKEKVIWKVEKIFLSTVHVTFFIPLRLNVKKCKQQKILFAAINEKFTQIWERMMNWDWQRGALEARGETFSIHVKYWYWLVIGLFYVKSQNFCLFSAFIYSYNQTLQYQN